MKRLPVTSLPPGTTVLAVSAVASVWGMIAVAAVAPEMTGILRTFFAILLAAAAGWLVYLPDFRYWQRISAAMGIVMLVLLFAVAVAGVEINGMRGWFDLGICTIQPSEIAKPFFALAVTGLFLSGEKKKRQSGLLLTGAYLAAVAMEPDFGTLSIYAAGGFAAAFLAGAELKHLLTAFAVTAAGAACYVWTAKYAVIRIYEYFFHGSIAESPWHWRQMQIAAARGGWGGTGSENTWWSSEYLPLAHNDSLYSVIAEGAGAGGAVFVSILWCIWGCGVYRMAVQASGRERKSFIAVLGVMTLFQAGLHIAVNTGLLPITGINLPLMSDGGSALLTGGIITGLIFSAARKGAGVKIA